MSNWAGFWIGLGIFMSGVVVANRLDLVIEWLSACHK